MSNNRTVQSIKDHNRFDFLVGKVFHQELKAQIIGWVVICIAGIDKCAIDEGIKFFIRRGESVVIELIGSRIEVFLKE